jgi:hypothetical protein
MRSGKLQMIHFRDGAVRAGNLGPGCSTPVFAQSEIAADCRSGWRGEEFASRK